MAVDDPGEDIGDIDLRLTIERQVIGVFGDQHLGDRCLDRMTTLDQPRRRGSLNDHTLTGGRSHGEWTVARTLAEWAIAFMHLSTADQSEVQAAVRVDLGAQVPGGAAIPSRACSDRD
ncbi:hypothetical protein X771_11495 [Mesorhizobium sp. LSJC277A00]|nr:hypothetical protein X771_11495 [Mesorhizobium sp. LSJC277A00]